MSTYNLVQLINEEDCIGDSLTTLNTNFGNLDTALCNLSSLETSLINSLKLLGSNFSSNVYSALNLINTGRTITSIDPANITKLKLSTLQPTIPCPSVHNIIYKGTMTNTIVPTSASFVFLKANLNDITYFSYGLPNNGNVIYVNGQQVPTTQLEVLELNTSPYLVLPNLATYNWEWNVIFTPNCTIPSYYNVPLKIKVVGYF